MKMEVVEVYVQNICPKYEEIQGTVHMYLTIPETKIGVDIRSIKFRYKIKKPKQNLWIDHFSKRGYDLDEKKSIKYPPFAFTDQKMMQEFMQESRKLIQEWFKKNKKLIIERTQELKKQMLTEPYFKQTKKKKISESRGA